MKLVTSAGKVETVPTVDNWVWTLDGIAVLLKKLQNDFKVTSKSFLAILGITRARLNYVTKVFHEQGQVPIEKRGGNHRSHQFVEKKAAVVCFLNSLKCVESHYCRSQTKRHYLPSELTINKLYKMYNKSCAIELKVKGSYFRSIFNTKFNLGFKVPRVDVCSTCTELAEKIKKCTDGNLKQTYMAQKRIHTLKYKEFYKFLKDESPEV
ncbi:hypothetical protein SFRURICE_001261 [Spodoptera frugiperda]|nr:hypothetical protein SFRURICE_001261 [Spodoptera frugiperda]